MNTLVGCGVMDYEQRDGVVADGVDPKDGRGPIRAEDAHLFSPSGVCMDPEHPGSVLLGTDDYQRSIRRLDPSEGACMSHEATYIYLSCATQT
jgi:hypothetical protein